MATMTEAAAVFVAQLYGEGRFDGILAAGGSGGTAIATNAMRALPVGVPKLMLSTMASGDTSTYVGSTDITMMASVTDIAGVNSISALILANAAAAMAGMVKKAPVSLDDQRPLIAATMFGVTTPAVTAARAGPRAPRLRGARVPLHRHRRKGDGEPGRCRILRRRSRSDDDRALRRVGRRCPHGRPRPVGSSCTDRCPPGGLTGRARHGELRSPRHGAGEVRGSDHVPAQPLGHPDANHGRGVGPARSSDRREALGGLGAHGTVHAAGRGLDDRCRRSALSRRRLPTKRCSPPFARTSQARSSSSRWNATSTTPHSRRRWRRSWTTT